MPIPRLAVEPRGPQRLHPVRGPTQPGAPIRTYPVVERNESIYIWHDVERREPYFEAPDIFAEFRRRQHRGRLLPAAAVVREGLEMHPQYVLENGVDFAHFKFVHQTPIVPVFTRHDFDEPVSYVDFTITFEGDDEQKIEDIDSRVEAINGGLGIAVTKSWGMIDNRTISAVTPVDDDTSDVRFMVYIGRTPGHGPERAETRPRIRRGSHPAVRARTSNLAAPTLFRPARAGRFRVPGLHRAPQVGQAVLSRRYRRQRRRSLRSRKAEPNDVHASRSACFRSPPATSAAR